MTQAAQMTEGTAVSETKREQTGRSRNPGVGESVRLDRRKHERRPAERSVRVYWLDSSGALHNWPGLMTDISAGGFGIEIGRRFKVRDIVSIDAGHGALQCVVRHVQQTPNAWIVGMQVVGASDGSNHQRSLQNLAAALKKSPETS